MRSERQYLQGIVSRRKTVATDLNTQIVDPTLLPSQLSTWSFYYLWNWLESVSSRDIDTYNSPLSTEMRINFQDDDKISHHS